jgi:hypothetical protein
MSFSLKRRDSLVGGTSMICSSTLPLKLMMALDLTIIWERLEELCSRFVRFEAIGDGGRMLAVSFRMAF